MKMVALGDLITPAKLKRAGDNLYPLLSMTMRDGLVDQGAKFKKRIASDDVSTYKVVSCNQLVVGFPIDEGVLDFQTKYTEAIVSPAYGIWNLSEPGLVFSDYLKKFLRSERALRYYRAKLRGSTARRRSLPAEVFLALDVPLPSVEDQRRIAAILDRAEVLRAGVDRAMKLLAGLQKSLFLATFGSPSDWSRHWPIAKIEDLADSVQYGTSAKAGPTGEYPMLRMGNVTVDGRLDLSDLKYVDLDTNEFQKYSARRGDVLFNRTNSPELVGKTAVVDTEVPLVLAGYLVRVRLLPDHRPEFVSGYLNSAYGKTLLRGMAKGAINQANISASELKKISIAVPPADLQERFAMHCRAIAARRAEREQQLKVIEALIASLQLRAFRGEL